MATWTQAEGASSPTIYVAEDSSALATVTLSSTIDTVILRRYNSGSLITNARYQKVDGDPGHQLAFPSSMQSGTQTITQWWEIAEPQITAAMAGVVANWSERFRLTESGASAVMDDTQAWNRLAAYCREKQTLTRAPIRVLAGHGKTGASLVKGSVDFTGMGANGVVDLNFSGMVIVGRGKHEEYALIRQGTAACCCRQAAAASPPARCGSTAAAEARAPHPSRPELAPPFARASLRR